MRLGGHRITGISWWRLLAVAGCIATALIVIVSVWPASPPKPNKLYTPAFAPAAIAHLEDGWLNRWSNAYGIRSPVQPGEFTGFNFAPSVGLPFHLEVYLPDPSKYSDYSFNAFGRVFLPAIFVTPSEPNTLTALSQEQVPAASAYFFLIGFPATHVPVSGSAYSLDALLYWRSDLLYEAQTQTPTTDPPVPVFLSDGTPQPLQPAELRAPATQVQNLDLQYREGEENITLHRVEWSAGNEVRLLVTLDNLGNRALPIWPGVSGSTASLPQSQTIAGGADDEGPLAGLSSLSAQQSVTGYITFGAAVADPNQLLTLRMPTENANPNGGSSSDVIIIRLKPASRHAVASPS